VSCADVAVVHVCKRPEVDSPNGVERVIGQRITMVRVRFTRQLGIAQDLARLTCQTSDLAARLGQLVRDL
jgi:hypothetical protein